MEEKRKAKRAPFNSKISVESLYTSGEKETLRLYTDITITNVSKTGIGFISEFEMPLNNYFNSRIEIDEDRVIYCVLKIVRCQKLNQGYQIGAEFVGMADIIGEYINEYVEQTDE